MGVSPIMGVSHLSFARVPESPPILKRAADTFNKLSHLFTDVTSCCDFFPWYIVGGVLGSDCISS